jgi:hypothetical protein
MSKTSLQSYGVLDAAVPLRIYYCDYYYCYYYY